MQKPFFLYKWGAPIVKNNKFNGALCAYQKVRETGKIGISMQGPIKCRGNNEKD